MSCMKATQYVPGAEKWLKMTHCWSAQRCWGCQSGATAETGPAAVASRSLIWNPDSQVSRSAALHRPRIAL